MMVDDVMWLWFGSLLILYISFDQLALNIGKEVKNWPVLYTWGIISGLSWLFSMVVMISILAVCYD